MKKEVKKKGKKATFVSQHDVGLKHKGMDRQGLKVHGLQRARHLPSDTGFHNAWITFHPASLD
jgi:hypothetical protein